MKMNMTFITGSMYYVICMFSARRRNNCENKYIIKMSLESTSGSSFKIYKHDIDYLFIFCENISCCLV